MRKLDCGCSPGENEQTLRNANHWILVPNWIGRFRRGKNPSQCLCINLGTFDSFPCSVPIQSFPEHQLSTDYAAGPVQRTRGEKMGKTERLLEKLREDRLNSGENDVQGQGWQWVQGTAEPGGASLILETGTAMPIHTSPLKWFAPP